MPEGQDVAAAAPPPAPPPGEESTPAGDLGITVALDQFNGPMDLLLYLVRRAEVDIKDLPVTVIADQFAAWVAAAAGTTLDLEAAGDFVVMAATLLEIKARMVAPPPEGSEVADDGEDDFDPRAGLIRKLLIYRAAKEAAFDLDRRDDQQRLRHHRGHREVVPDDAAEVDAWELKDVGAGTLANLWFDLLKRIDGLGPRTVLVDDVPMGVRMAQMVEDMRQRGEGRLSELFAIDSGPVARVSIVMAVLECTRQRLLRVAQSEQYGDVTIRFRAEDDRAISAGDPGPPEQLPKRQRRPPLVTWDSAPATESEESEPSDEPVIENEEQRFLRELESSVGVERLLSRAADLEKGFIAWWEETHPGEPLPAGVVKPEPPPPPPPPPPPVEAKAEAPAKPKRQPKPVAPPAEPTAAKPIEPVPTAEGATPPPIAVAVETPPAVIPDPAPPVPAAPPSPEAATAAIADPAPPLVSAPPMPLVEVESPRANDAMPAVVAVPAVAAPTAAVGPSFEVVPLVETPPQPEAGLPTPAVAQPEEPAEEPVIAGVTPPVVTQEAVASSDGTPPVATALPLDEAAVVSEAPTGAPVEEPAQLPEAVTPVAPASEPVAVASESMALVAAEPPVPAPAPTPTAEPTAVVPAPADPVVPEPVAAESAPVEPVVPLPAEPVACAPQAAEPIAPAPPPDPPPPPPTATANTTPIPATTTPNQPSKPTPMSRPRHLKTIALAALWLLSTVALVAWFQRPGKVLTVSGPDNVVVARDGELTWSLNLALDPEDRAKAALPQVDPPAAGSVAWRDERTCVFTPAGALPAASTLTLRFDDKLRAKGGFRFDPEALPVLTVRTLAAVAVSEAAASAPAFGDSRIELVLNRAPADPAALLAAVAVSPAVPLSKAVVDGRLRLTGPFVPGTTYTVTVADTVTGRADDRPSAWRDEVTLPPRTPGARLAAGVGRQAVIEAVNLAQLVVENAAGQRATLHPGAAAGDVPARVELPAWLLEAGENRLHLRWNGGEADVVLTRHDLRLTPDDGAPVLLGGSLPVISTR